MNARATAPKIYPTPFWVFGTYKPGEGISGHIAGKPYRLDVQTQTVFKKVDASWVAMTDAECIQPKYNIKDVLQGKYNDFRDIAGRSIRRAKAKGYSINTTRQANQRRI
ncbi:hypothetical protein [Alkanindiges illinoisensis]|uniref:hypothetical protein n=1 Tax=Alkanindiges illinoisensis TaxID=197183 RepID=UPI00047AD50D|nr:hypothetical protein [Alkanindiges illinoisensis]